MIRRALCVLVLVLGLGFAGSYGNARAGNATPGADQPSTCGGATRDELAQFATDWTNALAHNDLTLLEKIVSPRTVHHAAAFADTSNLADLETLFTAITTAFPDAVWTTNLVLVDDPYVVMHQTVTGTQRGMLQGAAPTGKTATWDTINVFRIECGQIVESWSELDQVGRLQQLGLMAGAPAAVLASSWTPAAATPTACPATSRADVESLLHRWWDAGWGDDPSALDAVSTDDVVHHWAMGPDSAGSQAQRERVQALRAAMPNLTITFGNVIVDGNYAAAVWQATGAQTHDFMNMPGTGKTATWNGINIFRIQCGEIAEVWSEMDTIGLIAQLTADSTVPAATPIP